MFANFLYFLVALIVYSTSKVFLDGQVPADHAVLQASFITIGFAFLCRMAFSRLAQKAALMDDVTTDHLLQKMISRFTLLALFIFTIDLYIFKLPLLFESFDFFDLFPTMEALIFLSFFICHLVMVWASAFRVQARIAPGQTTQKDFIRTHLMFSLPALLPWFIISIVADMIQFLPWEPVTAFLSSPSGELVYILVLLVPIAILAPVFIARIWNCRPLAPGPERSSIEQVCSKAGMRYTDILKWDLFGGSMITAGIMGLIARFRYILVTPALLSFLNLKEIEAVILHETGHVQKKHMLFYLLFFVGFMLLVYFTIDPLILLLYVAQPLFTLAQFLGLDRKTAAPVYFCITLIGFFILYFRFVFGYFMRNFERQADIHIFSYIPDAHPLITTFHKIVAVSRQSPDKPNWHHFGISQRIEFLKKCQQNPSLINRHNRKIKKMLAGFLVSMILLCTMGYMVGYGKAKAPFEAWITRHLIQQELALNPDNAELYVFIADYYYGLEKYRQAKDAYENVLELDPDNVHALNNLAWLLCTCPDTSLLDPEKAVKLAGKAAGIDPSPHILDTHAEACFAFNDLKCAVEISKRALEKAGSRKKYYQEQFERFKSSYDKSHN